MNREEMDVLMKLDCREEDNSRKLNEVFEKVGPLSNAARAGMVPIELLEKLVKVLSQKYEMKLGYIVPQNLGVQSECAWYDALVESTKENSRFSKRALRIIYAESIYEVYAKVAIAMWYFAKSGEVPKRGEAK